MTIPWVYNGVMVETHTTEQDMTSQTVVVDIDAIAYADEDDCLAAAARDYVEDHPELAGWDLDPAWADDGRSVISLSVPAWVFDEPIKELGRLWDHDWTVVQIGDWVLVSDTATVWWARASDITQAIVDELAECETEQATRVADLIPAHHDDEVPSRIVAKGRRYLDREDGQPVARGW